MRIFSLLSVNKIWFFFILGVWQEYFIYVFVCVCVCLFQRQYSEAHDARVNVHLCPWDSALEQEGLRKSYMQKITSIFLQHPLYSDKILTMDFQIQSCSALSSGPFLKAATRNNPEIAHFPANPSTVLSQVRRLQLNSLSSLGFVEKFVWLTLPSVGIMEKINLHLNVKKPQSPNTQRTEIVK